MFLSIQLHMLPLMAGCLLHLIHLFATRFLIAAQTLLSHSHFFPKLTMIDKPLICVRVCVCA